MSEVRDISDAVLARRNGQSVMVTLHQMNEQLAAFKDQVSGLHATIATLTNRVLLLEQFVNVLRVERMGRGPTA